MASDINDVKFYDVNSIESRSLGIVLTNGKIDTISESETKGSGIRALCGGSWGYTSISGNSDLQEGIFNAKKLALSMDRRSPKEDVSLGSFKPPKSFSLPRMKKDPADIATEDKILFIREIEHYMKSEGLQSTNISYFESKTRTSYRNSEDSELSYDLVRSGFSISAVAGDTTTIQAGRESRFDICGYEIFDMYDPYELAQKAIETAKSLLTAKTPKGGSLPVILDPELAGVFTHEAVGHASEADLVLMNDSILGDKLGQIVSSSDVTVIDDPTLHKFGYFPFDAEGSESQKTVLIDKGKMNSFMHSRETATRFGAIPGNARSEGYAFPHVRMSNTFIERGNSDFEEMVREIKDGIYLIGSRGGQVNTGEGIFQFNAEKGFLIKNGEIGEMIRDVSLSGKTLEILNNIILVGNDVKLNAGFCGKSGQMVPVSDGAPHIALSKATVGGC